MGTRPQVAFARWSRWLRTLTTQVLDLYTERHVWQEVGRIVQENGSLPPSYFLDWMADEYTRSAAIAVRRLSESNRWKDKKGRVRLKSKPVISLVGLLEDMHANNRLLTRERFVARYSKDMREAGLADSDFESFAGSERAYVSKAVVEAEIASIRRAARPIQKYVNTHIAHHDQAPMRRLPTYADLNRAIDAIGHSFRRCELMVKSSQHSTLVPVFQYNWMAIFEQPWIQ